MQNWRERHVLQTYCARKFNIPRIDVGNADILYGGWGTLGALTASGEICTDPASASLRTFACFKVQGAAFGWLQGTSMSSPNATGVAALVLAAHKELQGNPDGLLARLKLTARTNIVNYMGPNDPANQRRRSRGTLHYRLLPHQTRRADQVC